jgi:hypothetical protein
MLAVALKVDLSFLLDLINHWDVVLKKARIRQNSIAKEKMN